MPDILQNVKALYEQQPYPLPPAHLNEFVEGKLFPAGSPADYFHLYWPNKPYRENLDILLAGCGTTQPAEFAISNPNAKIVGIDISQNSLNHAQRLLHHHGCTNVTLHCLPIEQLHELGQTFDLIATSGVLHHMADPAAGLASLRDCLKPNGRLFCMVYATYGRLGVYMWQKYCKKLGIKLKNQDFEDLKTVLKYCPADHPFVPLAKRSTDLQSNAGLADLLLHPQDRSYTVPELFDWIEGADMTFDRWFLQATYLPQCSILAQTPHADKLAKLPLREQYEAVELFRGNLHKHTFIATPAPGNATGSATRETCHASGNPQINFKEEGQWKQYKPIRFRGITASTDHLPAGKLVKLQQAAHEFPVLTPYLDDKTIGMYQAIDQNKTLGQIAKDHPQTKAFFKMLWDFDQVFFKVEPDCAI